MKPKHEKMLLGGILGAMALATVVGIATNQAPAATKKTRMTCDDGYVLVGGIYQRPDWICVKGHVPRDVPVE
jgi:hypothetical protein